MPVDIIFFGSPDFAVPSLRSLTADARCRVRLVVTQPDRQSGRGRRSTPPPVKQAAIELNLDVWQPTTLRSAESIERLRYISPDLFVVVAYGEIFRKSVLEIPRRGSLNVHPSLLPKYRGSSPIQAAILNGDTETGVSIIQLVRQLDAGPIVAQHVVPLSGDETTGALSAKLAAVAARMLPDVVTDWTSGLINATPQDDARATFTRELRKEDGQIDWKRTALEIERHVRAMAPWPKAWSRFNDQRVVITRVSLDEPSRSDLEPGRIDHDRSGVWVGTGSTPIRIDRVQPEGRREMDARDWARGAHLTDESRFAVSPGDEYP